MGDRERLRIKRFLEKEVASIYNSQGFSGLERWAPKYVGEFRDYVPKVIEYLKKKNTGGSRIFQLDDSEVESILEKIMIPINP